MSSLAPDAALLLFYRDAGPDAQGRTHAEILRWSDERLEAVHDYIQWLFPLPEPSGVNRSAPLLTPAAISCFEHSEPMRARLRAAFQRMLCFYGFSAAADGKLSRAPSYPARARVWLTPYNHNYLRLTRILRSVHLCGLTGESAALFTALSAVYEEEQRSAAPRISGETFSYWQRAAR